MPSVNVNSGLIPSLGKEIFEQNMYQKIPNSPFKFKCKKSFNFRKFKLTGSVMLKSRIGQALLVTSKLLQALVDLLLGVLLTLAGLLACNVQAVLKR